MSVTLYQVRRQFSCDLLTGSSKMDVFYTKWDGRSAATYLQVEMLRFYRLKSLTHIVLVRK